MRHLVSAMLVASAIGAQGCTPIVDKRGYVPEPEQINSVSLGVDTKDQIYSKLGSPSTMATFEIDTWYYISSQTQRIGFFAPKIVDRSIVAVKFDEDDVVSDVANYGLEDGQVVNYVNRSTPTRGKELTFLEQMFGNVGQLGGGQ